MHRPPRHIPPHPNYLMLMLLVALGLVSACTKNDRMDTLRVSLTTVNAARDGFVAWDEQHQKAIVEKSTSKDEGMLALESYREARGRVVLGFEVAYRALAVAATQTDEPSLKAALAASDQLIDAVHRLFSPDVAALKGGA